MKASQRLAPARERRSANRKLGQEGLSKVGTARGDGA
jgi:hypothetical protein